MKVKFWGTRGSIATPLKPEEVTAKLRRVILEMPDLDSHDEAAVDAYLAHLPPLVRGTVGGNTPCVSVHSDNDLWVLDAGTGLRELGLELMKGPFGRGEGTLHLLISHLHWDHIQGFPMFVPAFIPGNRIRIYGFHDLRTVFELQQQPLTWPVTLQYMSAQIEFVPLDPETPLRVGRMQVESLKNHHPGDSYSYRLSDGQGTLVYATDVEYKQLDDRGVQQYINFFRGADALIFDSQYTLREAWKKEDWGHSSALIGVDLARAAGVKRLFLFHHDPTYSDLELERILADAVAYQAQDPERPKCEISIAYEGLEVDLSPERAIDWQLTPDSRMAILTSARVFDELSVELVARQMEGAAGSILDLSRVETLTTGGLKALVTLQQKQPGRVLTLVAPSERVRRVIRLAGYQDYFADYPSLEAAMAAVAAREAAQLPGQVIGGRYQIESRLGESALGATLRVLDLETQEPCALRLLAPTFSEETLEGVLQLVRPLVGLNHPNWIPVRAWDRQGELVYMVEALPEARTLEELLRESGPQLSEELGPALLQDLSRALEYIHSRGIVHGDLRPGHIYVTEFGVRIGGLGVGRLAEGRDLREAPAPWQDPAYLAPEQILGQPVDARTDLYALGVILYRIFTGRLPFEGPAQAVLEGHLQQSPLRPGLLNPQLSPSLEHLILKLLAKNPNDRYASSQQTGRISASFWKSEEGVSSHLMVMRETPLQELLRYWGLARQGKGQLVFVSGEPGIGKTMLVRQAAAASEAPVLLIGAGEERDGTPAYHIFIQVLRAYLVTVPPELRDPQMRALLGNFMGLIPELKAMLPDITPPPPLEPAQEQLRLMGSLTRFVKRATQDRPWFVVLEDLQWAERSCLELLRYLARQLPTMALLLVGIYRDSELEGDHPLRDTLRALNNEPGYGNLTLERLDETGVNALLEGIWQCPIPFPLADKIYRHTAGNPLYVEELAKSLADSGQLVLRAGRLQLADNWERMALPASVQKTVLKRVWLLPEETQRLLEQASVLGPSFHYLDLREMSGLSEWGLLERLEPALERQLLLEAAEGQLNFRHGEICQILYGNLNPLRRRLLHRQAGEALERRWGAALESRVEELAHHFNEAGDAPRAIRYGMQIARQAHRAYALDSALLWYQRTLAQVQAQSEPDRPLEIEIHRALSQTLSVVNRYPEALSHCQAAWDLLAGQPTGPEWNRQRAGLCYEIGLIDERRSEYGEAMVWIRRGLSYLNPDPLTPEWVQLIFLSGKVDIRREPMPAAREKLAQALEGAQTLGLKQLEAMILPDLVEVLWHLDDLDAALTHAEHALQLYQELGDRRGESRVLNSLGVFYVRRNHYDRARECYKAALEVYREIGDWVGYSRVYHNLGMIVWDYGDLDRARHYFQMALDYQREGSDRWGEAFTLSNLGEVYLLTGEYEAAGDCFDQCLEIRRQIGDHREEGEIWIWQGTLAHLIGDDARAEAAFNRGMQIVRGVGTRQDLLLALIHWGHFQVRQGRLAEAAESWAEAAALLESRTQMGYAIRVRAGLADLRLAQGDLDGARSEMAQLLDLFPGRVRRYVTGPFIGYWISYRVLQALGDPRAEAILTEAHEQLLVWAARLEPPRRQQFLERVAIHRDLLEWFEADRRGDKV